MSARKVRQHITLLSIMVPLATIVSGIAMSNPLRAEDQLNATYAPSLSQQDGHAESLDSSSAGSAKSDEGENRRPGVEEKRNQSSRPDAPSMPSEHDLAKHQAADFEARANELLNPIKEKLRALIMDNTRLRESVAELQAKLRDAHEAAIAANKRNGEEQRNSDQLIKELKHLLAETKRDAASLASRYQKLLAEEQTIDGLRAALRDARQALSSAHERNNAEQQKRDELIERLKNLSNAAKRDADALTVRHQKLADDYQIAISKREQAEAELSETKQKLLDIEKKYQQMSAVLEKIVPPKKARETALAWQRLRKQADNVAGQIDKAIRLAADKLTIFDRHIGTVSSTRANASSVGVRTARELKNTQQDLDAIGQSASRILEHFQKIDSEVQENSEALIGNSNSLEQLSSVIQENQATLDRILKNAIDLQKKKSSLQTGVNDLISAHQSVRRLSTTLDTTSSAIAEKIANLEIMSRQHPNAELPSAEPGEQSHSRIEANLQEVTSKADAAEEILSQLASATAALKDQVQSLSKDASELSLQLSTSQEELQSSGSDLKNLADRIQNQHVPTADQIERISATLHAYGEEVAKQKGLLFSLSLGLGNINERLDEAAGSLQASRDVLKAADAELSDQASSMKKGQATTETVKAKIEGFARKAGDGPRLANLNHDETQSPTPGPTGRKGQSQQSQAMRKIDSLLSRIAGTSQELNARIKKISKLEVEVQATGRELEKRKNSLAKQVTAAADLGPRYDQLESSYKTLVDQNKALDRAQKVQQKRALALSIRVTSLQDRLFPLQAELQAGFIGEKIQSKIASVLAMIATENIGQRRNDLARIRKKLGALSLTSQPRRTMPAPVKRDAGISSVRTEPSKKPAGLISEANPGESENTAGKISVECKLTLPSCRKWLFLRKKSMQLENDTANVSNGSTPD